MAVAEHTEQLALKILEIIRAAGPLSPNDIEARLEGSGISPTQTELRDTIWALVHGGELILTPERRLRTRD